MSNDHAVLGFSRFGYGLKPYRVPAPGVDLRIMLAHEIVERRAAQLAAPNLLAAHQVMAETRQAHKADPLTPGCDSPRYPIEFVTDEFSARLDLVRSLRSGFVERLVAFWANHFCVAGAVSVFVYAMAGPFEREAIRPFALGRFEDMLIAVAQHPAMLLYLENTNSTGPHSGAGQRSHGGLNENFGRELLELHTVGVNGGYDQDDVIAAAKIFSGWAIDFQSKAGDIDKYRFVFIPDRHEPGPQTVMGKTYYQTGMDQGLALLRDLGRSHATARHVALKFARHFTGDTPDPRLVERLVANFIETDGDLQALALTLVRSDEAWQAPPQKFKTPQEFIFSSLRAIQPAIGTPLVLKMLDGLGQPLWKAGAPDGFSDIGADWLAPDAMTARVEVAQQLAERSSKQNPLQVAHTVLGDTMSKATRQSIERADSRQQALVLLLMSPEFQRR